MAGLLSAIGGTLAGMGQGLAQQAEEDGKAKREDRLAELQHGYRMDEEASRQRFQTSERVAGQGYQTTRDATKFGQDKELKGIDHGYRMGEIGAQGANTLANTKLSDELTTKRDATKFGQDKELEDLRSGNRIKEDRVKEVSSGASKEVQAEFDRLNEAYKDKPKVLREMLATSRFPELRRLVENSPATSLPKSGAAETPASATSQADAISSARAAIAKGAPKDAVVARLRQMGITPPSDL